MKNLFKTGLLALCSATVALADHTQLIVTMPEVPISETCEIVEKTEKATVAVCPKTDVPMEVVASIPEAKVEQKNRKIHKSNEKKQKQTVMEKKDKKISKTMQRKDSAKQNGMNEQTSKKIKKSKKYSKEMGNGQAKKSMEYETKQVTSLDNNVVYDAQPYQDESEYLQPREPKNKRSYKRTSQETYQQTDYNKANMPSEEEEFAAQGFDDLDSSSW